MADGLQIPDVHYAETPYGFEFGSATITRMHHNKDGAAAVEKVNCLLDRLADLYVATYSRRAPQ